MNRKAFLSFSFLFLLFNAVYAQLPDGSTAPDWTLTDINGNSWNLYSLTAQGKTVFIDVSTTWCVTCWNYHRQHSLDSLYEEHGPHGSVDQSCYVFFIEADPMTGIDALKGKGGTEHTMGNWVDGTAFPIINPGKDTISQWLQLYAVNYYPTIYMICPGNKIYHYWTISHQLLLQHSREECPSSGKADLKKAGNGFSAHRFTSDENAPAVFFLPAEESRVPRRRAD